MKNHGKMVALVLLAGCASAPPPAQQMAALRDGELFRDDFAHFPAGALSEPVGEQNPAIQEYHWLSFRGVPIAPWESPIVYLDAWTAGDEDGQPYLEMHLGPENKRMIPKLFSPSFVTGDAEWSDYAVEVLVRPLLKDDSAGVVFRYHTNRHHYVFVLEGGTRARLAVRQPLDSSFAVGGWRPLGTADVPYDVKSYRRLRVETHGPQIKAYVDGKLVISAEDSEILKGKAGVMANVPTRFRDFVVTTTPAEVTAIGNRVRARVIEEQNLQRDNPAPKLWRKFETPRFGCGRNVRFGDLDGDGVPEMVFAQVIMKVDAGARSGGNFIEASALTAVNLQGKILWQIGRPDPRNGLLTSDTPFQIHDTDGDGQNEVVLVKDFKFQVLDGRTGKQKKWMWMPEVADVFRDKKLEIKERPYELNAGDSISFFDLSGKGRRSEILLKDRYRFFWVYDADLKPLWTGGGQLGHFPFAGDIDADGRDEVFVGYAMWTSAGKQVWSNDTTLLDHADGLAAGNYTANPAAPPRVYAVGSDEGFLMFDLDGKILKHHRIGHPQNMTIAKLRPELPGLTIATINFWKNPGILTILDADGNILQQDEPIHSGSMLLPVNWRGDGQEFLLLSGDPKEGGLVDGHVRRVVMFPNDGHPTLAASVQNLTGDDRDEIVLWDQERVWIYTQDRAPTGTGDKLYAPLRNPSYNDSNYRALVSLPRWRAKQEHK